MAKFSAYLQIYNDWSILPAALKSLVGRIDELVVVDGAYEWMVPYLKAIGKDPLKSDDRVYAALNESGLKYRAIQRVWKNQLQKRATAFQACSSNYIFRVDADEIFFFDDNAIDKMLCEGAAVGEMEMPLYLAPGWLVSDRGKPGYPKQCFFFDRNRIDPQIHLNYLWLVLEGDSLPLSGELPFPVYEQPLAFNAHLSAWRTADTSANRTAYYMTNWMRKSGVAWLPALTGKPMTSFDPLFAEVPPAEFLQLLETDRGSLGKVILEPHEEVVRSSASAEQEGVFKALYDVFLASLASHNRAIRTREQAYVQGLPIFLDVSTRESRNEILAPDDALVLSSAIDFTAAEASLHVLGVHGDANRVFRLRAEIEGKTATIHVPDCSGAGVLRQMLEVALWVADRAELQRFQAGASGW